MKQEIGHALGLSNAGEASKYISEYSDDEIYVISHPTIPDSVMSYYGRTGISEPDCSPHPFDIMAIYALYQNIP